MRDYVVRVRRGKIVVVKSRGVPLLLLLLEYDLANTQEEESEVRRVSNIRGNSPHKGRLCRWGSGNLVTQPEAECLVNRLSGRCSH